MKFQDAVLVILKANPILLISAVTGVLLLLVSLWIIFRDDALKIESDETAKRLAMLEVKIHEQSLKIDRLFALLGLESAEYEGNKNADNTHIDIKIPRPMPEKNIGYLYAVSDTISPPKGTFKKTKASKIFKTITKPDALINLAISGQVTLHSIILAPRSQRVESNTKAAHEIFIDVQSNSTRTLKALVPKGQVFENKQRDQDVQNLVVAEEFVFTLEPGERKSICLPGFCLNQERSSPSGQSGNITPMVVNFRFSDQYSLWAAVRKINSTK